jgi:hypothetical protein
MKTLHIVDTHGKLITPNVMVECLALTFRSREVPSSDLYPERGYTD